ncbi:Outer membrane protein TolC [Saccharicrinis carchari]|uniref:Outer membrane protein TolC n=1 Tax=Saccharicrinis carchari TaxID=1168039 RepID=A0A521EBB9_SACCC|nr:TolC family protein [Saccharicrinis carchari]SMO81225.1 Outer membrane protein TolC [Saccharicrinis carchari]
MAKIFLKRIALLLVINVIIFSKAAAQKEEIKLNMTLDQAIEIAFEQSILSFKQKHMYLARYWEFRSYKAERLPLLGLSSTPINYQSTISSRYINGEDVLVPSKNLSSNATLDLSQNITATGARVSVFSEFRRLENLESGNISYSSIPISVGISQPIGGYNRFKWRSMLEPLKFEQAKLEYLQGLQELSGRTTNVFFNLAKAEINLGIAETNLSNADTLYRIGKGRFEIGTVTQDELLDLELSYLNANINLSRAKVDLEQARSTINSFLGFDENVHIECILPSSIPEFKIQLDRALAMAYENNPDVLNFEQRLIQADSEIAQAKGTDGFDIGIRGNFGYNKNTDNFDEVYSSPFERDQRLSLTLGVPIIDWGKRRGQVQMARSNKEVTEAEVRQAKIDFEQNVFLQVMEFNMQEEQVKISAKADTIAQLGYEVTKQRFLIDKVDVIKLNSARNSVDAAKRSYIQSLQTYWTNYFNIRRITLFDFEGGQSLIKELDDLLQN